MKINEDFLEKCLLWMSLRDKTFCTLLTSAADSRFFESSESEEVFSIIKEYFKKYRELPKRDTIIGLSKNTNEVSEYLKDIDSIDEQEPEFVYSEAEEWIKENALKYAVLDTVQIINSGGDRLKSRELIENALTKTLRKDIGLNYWETIGERLKRIFNTKNIRIPSCFPQLDEYLNGGFQPMTLSILGAAIHGCKSQTMISMAGRQSLKGFNSVFFSMEMAQDEVAKRFDASFTGLDINRIYDVKKNDLIHSLKEYKNREKGSIFIKQFPTGIATVNDLRSYLYELQMRGYSWDCVYVDYLNIMSPTVKEGDGNLYTKVKRISEELRALSFDFKGFPIVSATQLNREGMRERFQNLNMTNVSESMGTMATGDFSMILGTDEDSMIYENEIFYKIIKNRLGGRVGEIDKLYIDDRSLKMYDSSEMDLWIKDASISGGKRELNE